MFGTLYRGIRFMDRIVLSGLEFYGHHGVHPEEARLGARFTVDVEMGLELRNVEDDVSRTVDYSQVYKGVKEMVEGERFGLIEALANRIAESLFANFGALLELTVRVHKPHAPLGGPFHDLYAEVKRTR